MVVTPLPLTKKTHLLTQLLDEMSFAKILRKNLYHCLFLDIDGTLSSFELEPTHSTIPTTTLALLEALQDVALPVAVVTGRGLSDTQRMLKGLKLPIASTHGLEITLPDGNTLTALSDKQTTLNQKNEIEARINYAARQPSFQGLLIEQKPYSVALHYRQFPQLEQAVNALMIDIKSDYPTWQLNEGKFVVEMMPRGADKGKAILTLLDYFQQGSEQSSYADCKKIKQLCPIFIGDDVTDEAGFLAVQQYQGSYSKDVSGIGIKVGNGDTNARWRISSLESVPNLLAMLVEHYQQQAIGRSV